MKKRNLLLVPAIALLGSSLSSAAVYNVKYLAGLPPIPTSSLHGVIGSTGESWNQATGTFSNLIDSVGGSSSITVGGLSGGQNEGPADSIWLGNSNQFGKGDNQTISISGLATAGVYDIYIYSLSHNSNSWGTGAIAPEERAAGSFITTNASGNGQTQALDNGISGTGPDTFTAGSNYVRFQNIVADSSGNISILVDALDGANPTRLHVNGLQIVEVPEPSSALLGCLGLIALLRRRRACGF